MLEMLSEAAQGNPILKDGTWPPNSCAYANTYNTNRENQHLVLLRKEKGFLFGRSMCSEPSATQVLYSNSRNDAWGTTGHKHAYSSFFLYSSEATHPLYNHKSSTRKVPRPLCSLPFCPIVRVWTWIKILYFPRVCWYVSDLCNTKSPRRRK